MDELKETKPRTSAIPVNPSRSDTGETADELRIKYGARLILAGFILLAIVVVGGLVKFDSGEDVSKIVLAVAGVVGTIIGTFFGVQAGSFGKERAEQHAKDAETRADQNFRESRDHAVKAADAHARGRSLAAAIRADRGGQGRALGPDRPATEGSGDRVDLAAMADELFPLEG
jgi:hypothetical protein